MSRPQGGFFLGLAGISDFFVNPVRSFEQKNFFRIFLRETHRTIPKIIIVTIKIKIINTINF